jgi:transcription elongation factor Elf1
MVLTDHHNQLVCNKCNHPVYSDIAKVNKGSDENGSFIICSICGNKIYLNKEKKE